MSHRKSTVSWFGLVLVLVGVLLLLDRLHVIHTDMSIILWVGLLLLGFLTAVRGFTENRSGRIFWGTLLFLVSVFFLLRTGDLMEVHAHLLPPAFFLMTGISFLMIFINNPREWGVLIPAVTLGTLGVILIMVEYGYLYEWDVWEGIRVYWPVVLILVGLSVLLKPRSRKMPPQPPPQEISSTVEK
jgi:hypothetical protein